MIRWPGMQGYQLRGITQAPSSKWKGSGSRLVYRDHDQDRFWVAPSWIAWLYRLLPNQVGVNLTAWIKHPDHFLWDVAAPTWRVGLLIRNRIPVLKVEFGGGNYDSLHHFYLPWGIRLFCHFASKEWVARKRARLEGHPMAITVHDAKNR